MQRGDGSTRVLQYFDSVTINTKYVELASVRAGLAGLVLSCYARQLFPFVLCERVTPGTVGCWEKKQVFIFEVGYGRVCDHGGQSSFSFDAVAFLSWIHLEDPKSGLLIGYLEQSISPDLAAVPVEIFNIWNSFQIESLALT